MIEVNNVSLSFFTGRGLGSARNRALSQVTFAVPEGSVYGLLGTNGAGKSTLMRTIGGVYRPDEGIVKIDGQEVWDNAEAKEKVCFVNDEMSWLEHFTTEGLCSFGKCSRAGFDADAYSRMISAMELPKRRRIGALSKGMRRQVATIFGIACRAKYLMLDESFDGLDPAMRRVVKEMLTDEVCERGCSVILSSHNVTEISETCDHVLILHAGSIVREGEIDEVCDGYRRIQLVGNAGGVTREQMAGVGLSVLKYSVMGSGVQAIVRGSVEEITAKTAGLPATLAEMLPLTLEEVFVSEMEEKGYGRYKQEA